MYPKLFHIYGPFELNSYNASIIIAIAVFLYACLRHPGRDKIIGTLDFVNISTESAIAAIIGGRLWHVISQWSEYPSIYDMISIWDGGLSILGALFGALAYSIIALRLKNISILAAFSIAALYAPLMHGIARIGCFLVGCCYGAPTTATWGITYTNPLVYAPLNIKMHPTQLYSSLFYFILFLIMYYYFARPQLKASSKNSTPINQSPSLSYNAPEFTIVAMYLMGMSFERFAVDFFRGDRIMKAHGALSVLSFHQWTALAIFFSTLLFLKILHYRFISPQKI